MTEELDLITFDAGGTLFDMQPSRDDIFVEMLTDRLKGLDRESIISTLHDADRLFDREFAVQNGKNEDLFWMRYDEYVFRTLGIPGDGAALHKDLDAIFDMLIPKVESWVEFPETRRVLEGLRRRDFKMGVISNATDLTKRVLDNLGLTKYFDFVIVSEEVGFRKPSAEIFRIAARKGHAAPNRTLHVGDKYSIDVVGATGAGMNAVLVDRSAVYEHVDCIRARDLNCFTSFA